MIYRYLDDVGDGSGNSDITGDYSAAASAFIYKCSAGGGGADLYRIIGSIGDTTGMQAQEYGNLGAALGVGWTLAVQSSAGTVLLDITDGTPIKTNAQIAELCFDVDIKSWGSGNELLVYRFTFLKAGSALQLDPGDKLVMTFNDNFTGLLSHRVFLQGTQGY